MSPDAPAGISGGVLFVDPERRSNPSGSDAQTGISREAALASSSVIRAAGVFARALAGHLGAELRGFGAEAEALGTDAEAAGTEGAPAAAGTAAATGTGRG